MAESSSLPFFSGLQKRKQSEYCRVPGSFPKKREKKRWNKWCPDEPRAKRQRIPDHRHPGEKEKRRSEAAELRERRFGHFLSLRNKPSESPGSHGTRSIHERCREEKARPCVPGKPPHRQSPPLHSFPEESWTRERHSARRQTGRGFQSKRRNP